MRLRHLAAGLALTVLAACAGASPPPAPVVAEPSESPAVLARTASPRPTPVSLSVDDLVRASEVTAAQDSFRFELAMDFRGTPHGRQRITGEGQLGSAEEPRGWMRLDLRGQLGGTLDYVFDGTVAYMRGKLFEPITGRGFWIVLDLESDDPALQTFTEPAEPSEDAATSFLFVAGAEDAIDVLAQESLAGIRTTRFAVTVDALAALERAPEEHRAELQAYVDDMKADKFSTTFKVEGWVDQDDLIRRVRYVWTGGPFGPEATMTATIDMSGFGDEVEITVPDKSSTIPYEDLLPG